jgi:ribosome-binding factor A
MNTSADRKGRAAEIIVREAAQFITREAGSGSLITVIRAQPVSHGDRVLVFVSIFPEDKAQAALNFLERHREDFSNHLKTHTRLRPLPRIEFMLDNREELGGPEPVAELPKS